MSAAVEHESEMTTEEQGSESDKDGHNLKPRVVLDKDSSLKCLEFITTNIIPQLQDCLKLNEKNSHKLAQSKTRSASDLSTLKVTLTTSFVRLLKKFPNEYSASALRPVIPTFCSFLKSKDNLVRDPVRKTLSMLLKEFGGEHFPEIVNCLLGILKRGYERHVLSYTISYLIKENQGLLLTAKCVPFKKILNICEEELFGEMQAEKDVQAIKDKTREARKDNAGEILEYLALLANEITIFDQMIEIPSQVMPIYK